MLCQRTADLPVMAEGIGHATDAPPTRLLDRDDLSGTCRQRLRRGARDRTAHRLLTPRDRCLPVGWQGIQPAQPRVVDGQPVPEWPARQARRAFSLSSGNPS